MTKLKKVTISAKVTTIGKKAFAKDTALTTVTMTGGKVKTISANAFDGCKKLKTVKINANALKTVGSKAFNGVTKKTTFTVSAKSKKVYKAAVKLLKKGGASKAKFKFTKKK